MAGGKSCFIWTRAKPAKRKPAFTAEQLRIIDEHIDKRVDERLSAKLAGLKATLTAQSRRGGCG